MKIFCTKYVLTKGIEELDVEECGSDMVKTKGKWPVYLHGEGKGWHRTKASAVTRAEEMRKKKIASLNKSLTKLNGMQFSE